MKLFFRKAREDEGDFFDFSDEETFDLMRGKHPSPSALTPEELLSKPNAPSKEEVSSVSPMEALKSRMLSSSSEEGAANSEGSSAAAEEIPEIASLNSTKSLLEKCHAYTVDDEGIDHSAVTEPLYQLESVAEILRNDSERALKLLSEKYDVSVHDLKNGELHAHTEAKAPEAPPQPPAKENPAPQEPQRSNKPEPTKAFERMVKDSEQKSKDREIFEELFPEALTIGEFGTALPDISDIDNKTAEKTPDTPDLSSSATIKFTPIRDIKSHTDRISISSITKHIDIGSELEDIVGSSKDFSVAPELELSEFEEFEPTGDPKNPGEAKKLIRKLSLAKRSAFLSCLASGFLLLLLSLFFIPPLSYTLLSNTKITMTVCLVIFGLGIISNFKMFADFKGVFSKRCNTGVLAAIASLAVAALGIIAVIEEHNVHPMLITGMLILFARALSEFWEASAMLGNLKQISVSRPKKAITLIDDTAVTYAMAKKSIEGDALIATPRAASFIGDFLKYSSFSAKLSGKISILTYISILVAAIIGIAAYSYFDGIYYALYCAAAVMCAMSMPSLFFIDSLPLFSAALRLNKKGAMIAGISGAQKLELANAVVLSSTDLFPEGTVTLQSMKVLSNNNIDSTIMRAASLTEAVGSTLAPIFKKIAGTNTSYSLPDSDTVKYEERLGLSGWVDNELLFIGNRTLMEAHGIEVPSVEFDRRILRKGYFPVYLASGGKACAVIVIQYDVSPEVAKEMRRITELGITVLVNNTDPNINESMLCDYIGLYEDSVKIMSNAGVHMHKNAIVPAKCCSAPAAFRGIALNFISVMNCASRIKRSNILLTLAYTFLSVLGALMFIYAAFSGGASLPTLNTVLLYAVSSAAVSIILFLFKKP